MMQEMFFRIVFTVGSFILLILLLISYISKKFNLKFRNKIYIYFLISCISVVLTEMITYIYFAIGNNQIIYAILTKFQCLAVISWGWLLLNYCYSMIRKIESDKFFKYVFSHKVLMIHTIYSIIAIVIALFMPVPNLQEKVITFMPTYAINCIIHYNVSAIIILILSIKNFKDLKTKDRIILFILVLEVPFFAILQNLLPPIAFLSLCNCLQAYIIYFYYENPDLFLVEEISNYTKETERINTSKAEILESISNELKSPINTIIELSDNILNDQEFNKDKILNILNNIESSSKMLLEKTNAVMENSNPNNIIDTNNENNNIDYKSIINSNDLSKYKILLVDDNELNLKVLKEILNKYNLNVTTTNSGTLCIQKIKENITYDLIFMDQLMPELNGIETLRILNKLSEMLDIPPVVAMTANVSKEVKDNCLKEGFADFLAKPINRKELERIIVKYLIYKQ